MSLLVHHESKLNTGIGYNGISSNIADFLCIYNHMKDMWKRKHNLFHDNFSGTDFDTDKNLYNTNECNSN